MNEIANSFIAKFSLTSKEQERFKLDRQTGEVPCSFTVAGGASCFF
jgi:hypothetical protein